MILVTGKQNHRGRKKCWHNGKKPTEAEEEGKGEEEDEAEGEEEAEGEAKQEKKKKKSRWCGAPLEA